MQTKVMLVECPFCSSKVNFCKHDDDTIPKECHLIKCDACGALTDFDIRDDFTLEELQQACAHRWNKRSDYTEKDIMMFIGWLSVDIKELNDVEMDRLMQSWDKFLAKCSGETKV